MNQRFILAAATIALLAGCGHSRQAAGGRKTIGLSVLTMTNPFFKEIADSIVAEGRKAGYDVDIQSGELDVARQQNQVKDFIVKGVAAIVLTPCDSKAIGPVIVEANRAGIPVFTADIACLAPEARVVSHVATDNKQGGRQAAEALVEAIGGRGKVAIIDHPEVESSQLRTAGFLERLAELNRDGAAVEVVTRLRGDGDRGKSFKVTQDILQAHPGIAGIFASNDPSALGVRGALEGAGKADAVKVVGFDGQLEAKRAIREGKIHADPIQFPDKIGVETMRAILRHFAGEKVPPQILIPTNLYRKADAEKDPALK